MKLVSWLGLGLALGAFLILFSPPRVFSASSEFVPGELLVRYKANVARSLNTRSNASELATGNATLDALNQHLGVQSIAPLFHSKSNQTLPRSLARIFKIKIADAQDVRSAAAMYAQDPNVEFAEPNYLARAILTPDDTEFAQQWGLTKISAPTAWDTTTGSASVTIALIDSGIDKTHTDLANKLWVNPGEVAGNSVDDDANGYVDDVNGWNFVSSNNNPTDDNGHGTLVAGVAGADTNNGIGVAGVCWQCKLMPVKVMSAGGSANYSDIAAGVVYAAQKGARVINLSLGGSADSQTLHAAIQSAANDFNAVVVAGAGNDNASANFYPAAYPEALAVAGTDENDVRVATSNYGAWVDVSAPGQNIHTTASGGGYATSSGTSLASPFAAGLAGLIRSQNPSWSQALVRAQIVNTTNNIDAANPSYVGQLGSGRINAANALGSAQPKLVLNSYSVNGTANGQPDPGTTASLQLTIENKWLDATNVSGTLSENDPQVSINNATQNFGSIVSGASAQNITAFSLVINGGAGYNYAIPLTLHLTANGGYSTDLNFTVTTRSSDENVGPVTIATNTTWTNDKIYVVNGDVAVASGKTLTIQPGTTIRFNGAYKLWILGTLIADGTQAQPILFTQSTPGGSGGVLFDNGSVDTVTDADGNYVSGNIMRYVKGESANIGVECNKATPFFSNLNIDALNCEVGTTPLWVKRSSIRAAVTIKAGNPAPLIWLVDNLIDGNVTITKEGDHSVPTPSPLGTVHSIGATLSTGAQVLRNNIGGRLYLTNDSRAEQNTFTGWGIHIAGTGQVISNTIQGGRILVESAGLVEGNNVENAPGTVIRINGTATVRNNRIVGSGGLGISIEFGDVAGNLIASNTGAGLGCGGATTVSGNTITGNQGSAILIQTGAVIINNNNLEHNKGQYDIENNSTQNINAQSNWWGTTNGSTIASRIFDFNDGNPTLGQVDFSSALSAPDQTAPAYVRNVTTNPASPVGLQTVIFEFEFSRPMDQNIDPVVTFGAIQPFNSFAVSDNAQWLNDKTWRATYDITSLISRGTYTMSVKSAVGLDGIEIAPSSDFTFQVDYAGGITDQTAPSQPKVTDDGVGTTLLTQLHTKWSSSDGESPITQYQYAIGTSPNATDVVNWTTPNPATATQVTHTGLNLNAGQVYYFSVRAQNEGGLWSAVGVSDGIVADPNFVPLGKPKLQSPVKNAVLTKPKIKLDWNDVAGATSYHIVVKQDKKNGKTVFENDATNSQVTKKLKKGKTYFWKVQACNAYGCFTPSKAWSFQVQ